MSKTKEAEWLSKHPKEVAKYKGEYIALVDDKVVAHGIDFIKVLEQAKKYSPDPLIHKVPKWDVMVV